MADVPRVVGISGKKRHGKGAIAERLIHAWGFTRVGFKDALVDAVRELNPIVGWDDMTGLPVRWAKVVDDYGYEEAKDHPRYGHEVVRVLQNYGTHIRTIQPDFWVDAWRQRVMRQFRAGNVRIVVDDVRFPNEAEAVERGGHVLRVLRHPEPLMPEALAAHISETALDSYPFEHWLYNDGPLAKLHLKVDEWVLQTWPRILSGTDWL
jgi:hypothetical protein